MVAQIFAFEPRQNVPCDWSQSELAELYRIENALLQSGLFVEHDRGLTDEGDPWFVFCRPDGEVLVHLTRFDGLYRLHSPALPTPLVGRSFAELTKAFSDQIPLQVVVQRTKGARLYVHPASMLAIIVSTIFLAAQDILPPQGTPDASKKGHDGGEAAAAHPLKASLQAVFQSHIDALIGWIENGGSAQQTTYLGLIGTVAAVLTGLADALMQDFGVAKADAEQFAQSTNLHQAHDDVAVAPDGSLTSHDSAAQQTKLGAFTEAADQSAQKAHDHQTPGDQAVSAPPPAHSTSFDITVSDADKSAVARQSETGSTFNGDHSGSTADGSTLDSGLSHWVAAIPLRSSPEVPALTQASLSSTPAVYGSTAVNDLLSSLNLVSSSSSTVQNASAEVNALLAHAVAFDSTNKADLAFLTSPNATTASAPPVFDTQAAAQLETFLKANPSAEAVFNDHSIVIYDSPSHASDSVLNSWKFPDGSTITLVGTSDHHVTLV